MMSSSCVAVLVVVFAVMSAGASRSLNQWMTTPPAPGSGMPMSNGMPVAPWYRYTTIYEPISALSNGSDIMALEIGVSGNCSQYFTSGICGAQAPEMIETSAYKFAKILDFPNLDSYYGYNNCTVLQPGRAVSASLTLFKQKILSMSTLNLSGASFVHVSAANCSSPANLTLWQTDRQTLLADQHIMGEIVLNADSTLFNTTQGLELLSFPDTNTDLGFYYYKNGNAANLVPILPFYATIKSYQLPGGAKVDIHPYVL